MRHVVLGSVIALVLAGSAMAQKTVKTGSSTAVDQSTSVDGRIASGTHVSGELQNSLDVRRAKVGDQVLLKTTNNVKQNGKTVIAKGSTLVGHVTSVQRQAKGDANSSLGVTFDSLQQGSSRIPISAVITSVLGAQTMASLHDEAVESDTYGSSSTQPTTRSSGGSGGLLGGVTNTAGSVLSTTTNTVGGVANSTGRVVRSTAGSLNGVSVTQSTNASAGSTLSMSGGDLHLEKGTTLNLVVGSSSTTSVIKH